MGIDDPVSRLKEKLNWEELNDWIGERDALLTFDRADDDLRQWVNSILSAYLNSNPPIGRKERFVYSQPLDFNGGENVYGLQVSAVEEKAVLFLDSDLPLPINRKIAPLVRRLEAPVTIGGTRKPFYKSMADFKYVGGVKFPYDSVFAADFSTIKAVSNGRR